MVKPKTVEPRKSFLGAEGAGSASATTRLSATKRPPCDRDSHPRERLADLALYKSHPTPELEHDLSKRLSEILA